MVRLSLMIHSLYSRCDQDKQVLITTHLTHPPTAYLAFFRRRGDPEEEILVGGVRSILRQFPQDIGTRTGSDVHIMCESSAVRGGTRERVLLGGVL